MSAIFRTRHPVTGALVDDTTFFDSQTAKKKIAAFKRHLARRVSRASVKQSVFIFQGGPFDGQEVLLSSYDPEYGYKSSKLRAPAAGTLPFTARGMRGFYDLSMHWVSLEK